MTKVLKSLIHEETDLRIGSQMADLNAIFSFDGPSKENWYGRDNSI